MSQISATTAAATTMTEMSDEESHIEALKGQLVTIDEAITIVMAREKGGILSGDELDRIGNALCLGMDVRFEGDKSFTDSSTPQEHLHLPMVHLGVGLGNISLRKLDVDILGAESRRDNELGKDPREEQKARDRALNTRRYVLKAYSEARLTLSAAKVKWAADIAECEQKLALSRMTTEELEELKRQDEARQAAAVAQAAEIAQAIKDAQEAKAKANRLIIGLVHTGSAAKAIPVTAEEVRTLKRAQPVQPVQPVVRTAPSSVELLNKALDENVRARLNGKRFGSLRPDAQMKLMKNAVYDAVHMSLKELGDLNDEQRLSCSVNLIADLEASSNKPDVETLSDAAMRQLAREILETAKADLEPQPQANEPKTNTAKGQRSQRTPQEAVAITMGKNVRDAIFEPKTKPLKQGVFRAATWGFNQGFGKDDVRAGLITGLQCDQKQMPCSPEDAEKLVDTVLTERDDAAKKRAEQSQKPQRPEHDQHKGRATHPNPGNGEATPADIEAAKEAAKKAAIQAPPKGLKALEKMKAALSATDTTAN